MSAAIATAKANKLAPGKEVDMRLARENVYQEINQTYTAERHDRDCAACADALEAALAGDYQKAARLCAVLAESGNVLAACDLAKIHREGLLGEPDYEFA